MIEKLSSRQRTILKLIVQDYVRTGKAVGSKTLIDRYKLDVSPATVRNEMGVLEVQEYLQHPHTSAGRVPTDLGYRYYVEHLLGTPRLPAAEQLRILHQFRQVQMQLASAVKLAAAVLAEASGNIALVTPPRSAQETVRHFELISLHDRMVLLILVTQSGTVHEAFLNLELPIEQQELSTLSSRLNAAIRDTDFADVRSRAREQDGLARYVLEQIAELMLRTEQESSAEIYSDGLERALRQPEFSRSDVAQQLLELLRGGAILSVLLPQIGEQDDVQIFIGSENDAYDLRSYAVIVARYGVSEDVSGLLGVLGPTRLPYGRTISTAQYIAGVLTDLLRNVYVDDPGRHN